MMARMAFRTSFVALASFALASGVLAACGTVSTSDTSTETSALEPQPSLASLAAPTATHAPTATPTAVLPTEPVLGPEQPAISVDQVAGVWKVRNYSGGYLHQTALTFERDGSYHTRFVGTDPSAGMAIDLGTYSFDDDTLVLVSDYCWHPSGDIYSCTAEYHVFVAMADSGPGKLRFVLVEDPDAGRVKYLTVEALLPYRQE